VLLMITGIVVVSPRGKRSRATKAGDGYRTRRLLDTFAYPFSLSPSKEIMEFS